MRVRTADLVRAGPGRLRNGEASMIALGGRSLLLAWTRFFGGTRDSDASDIWAMASGDGGGTWSESWPIIPGTSEYKTGSPSLLLLPSGTILCVAGLRYSDRRSVLTLFGSTDHGRSFSPGANLWRDDLFLGCHNDRLVQTSDSRLLLPFTWKTDAGLPRMGTDEDSRRYRSTGTAGCLYSDDEGKSWNRSVSELTVPKRGAAEPCVVELRDERILLTARTQLGFIYASHSADQGLTWSALRPTSVTSPEAPHTIKRSAHDGLLYLVGCPQFVPDVHHHGPRFPLLLSRSRDEGESWEECARIDDGPDREFSNCSMLFCDRTILLTYYARHLDRTQPDYNCKDLRLAMVDMEEGQ